MNGMHLDRLKVQGLKEFVQVHSIGYLIPKDELEQTRLEEVGRTYIRCGGGSA
jgi:hypothetical protein